MSRGAGQNRVAERVSRYVPFWEVPGSNVRLECGEVFQVNIFWSLMLAPLPHNFVKWKQRVDFFEIADFFFFTSLSRTKCSPRQSMNSGRNRNHILPVSIHIHSEWVQVRKSVSEKFSTFSHLRLIFMDCFLWYFLYIFRDRFNSLLVALLSKTGNCWVSFCSLFLSLSLILYCARGDQVREDLSL